MLSDWSRRARKENLKLCRRRYKIPMMDDARVPFLFVSLWVLTVACRRQRGGQEQQDGDRQTSHGVEGSSWLRVWGLNLTAWLSVSIFIGGFTKVRCRAFVCLQMWRALVFCGHGTITPPPTPQLSNHYNVFLSNVWALLQVVEASCISTVL